MTNSRTPNILKLLFGAVGMLLLALSGCDARSDHDGPKGAGNHAQRLTKPKRSQGGLCLRPAAREVNYAVMYSEGFVDKTSGQYKASFNQIHNESNDLYL